MHFLKAVLPRCFFGVFFEGLIPLWTMKFLEIMSTFHTIVLSLHLYANIMNYRNVIVLMQNWDNVRCM